MEEQRECEVCGINITDRKASAVTCSPKCRKALHDRKSVTENVTLNDPSVTETIYFEFYTISKANGTGRKADEKSSVRKAKYWYDVPLGAVPVIKKDWPGMPDFMNGRQYFLWWKNEFKEKDGTPVILNPFPVRDNVTYVQAGQDSRRWGA